MSNERDRYFAYGSNMDPEQMDHRGLAWDGAEGASLAGHRLVFDFDARGRWLGGAADIVPDPDGTVEGVLYQLEGAIAEMDRCERGYLRVEVEVVGLESGRHLVTWTYEVVSKGRPMAPSEVYVDQMLKGARRFGLSEDHTQMLEALRARGHEDLGEHVRTLRGLAQAGRPLTGEELAHHLGIDTGRVARLLSDLDEWGWLEPGGPPSSWRVLPEKRERAPWILK
ncbi:MAG: helix-turn-helix domain-containing protein [Thermoplasmata archaeon]|nr:helix-turn-helix domain-containing protein [Thermoplasmata archaeon]